MITQHDDGVTVTSDSQWTRFLHGHVVKASVVCGPRFKIYTHIMLRVNFTFLWPIRNENLEFLSKNQILNAVTVTGSGKYSKLKNRLHSSSGPQVIIYRMKIVDKGFQWDTLIYCTREFHISYFLCLCLISKICPNRFSEFFAKKLLLSIL